MVIWGGSFYDALLIILSVLSATSSNLWKDKKIDKKRFVELLIRYNTTEYDFSDISIFIMHQKEPDFLSKEQHNYFFNKCNFLDTKIYTGSDVDVKEADVLFQWPKIKLKELRKFSYASLFYDEIRSFLIHEYSVSDFASIYPMSQRNVFVSYVNCLHNKCEVRHQICFHFDILLNIVKNIAQNVATIDKLPLELPQKWWIDGAEK